MEGEGGGQRTDRDGIFSSLLSVAVHHMQREEKSLLMTVYVCVCMYTTDSPPDDSNSDFTIQCNNAQCHNFQKMDLTMTIESQKAWKV